MNNFFYNKNTSKFKKYFHVLLLRVKTVRGSCNEKGVALIVTLAIVAVLIAAGLHIWKFTSDSAITISHKKNRFDADQLALSGINIAMLLLSEDAANNNIDSNQEAWADSDKLLQLVNELGLEKDRLIIKITDELSKIQVNALLLEFPGNQINPDQQRIWENLLNLLFSSDKSMDERDPAMIINSLKDWLDSRDDDAITGISGAESDHYQELDPPYVCANGPFNRVDELLNVKGVSKELLQSEFLDENDEIKTVTIELDNVFSVYGMDKKKTKNRGYMYPGKVNINTASVEVLAALLPVGKEDYAFDLINFRDQRNEDEDVDVDDVFINSLEKGWYKKVIDLSANELKRFERVIKYSSDIFKVECTAQKNNVETVLTAFVKREIHKETGKWICRIIQKERG